MEMLLATEVAQMKHLWQQIVCPGSKVQTLTVVRLLFGLAKQRCWLAQLVLDYQIVN